MKKKLLTLILLILFSVSTTAFAATDRTALSDPDTMDSWQTELSGDSTENTGKLWTDFSVLENPNGKVNSLDYGTGGPGNLHNYEIDGKTITSDADFMNVLSLMGQSERFDYDGKNPEPMDVVFVLDISGTTGWTGLLTSFELGNTRIQRMLKAINTAIDFLMEDNALNRVGVSVYGTTSAQFMPLAHYSPDSNGDYLTVDHFIPNGAEGFFTLNITGTPTDRTVISQTMISNDPNASTDRMGTENTVGLKTNLDAGLFDGMQMLSHEEDTRYYNEVLKEYKTRKPVLIALSDGQANVAYSDPYYSETIGNRNSLLEDGSDVVLQTLLTASYNKKKVQENYTETDFTVLSYGIDLDLQVSEPYKALAYAVLDPSRYFNSIGYEDSSSNSQVLSAYSKYKNWCIGALSGTDKTKFPPLPEGVELGDIKSGIYYNSDFTDLNSSFMGESVFEEKLLKLTGDTPHVADGKISFTAQSGEYMKVTDDFGLILFGNHYPAYKYKEDRPYSGSSYTDYYYRVGKSTIDRSDIFIENPAYTEAGSLLSEIEIRVRRYNYDNKRSEDIEISIPENLIPVLVNVITVHSDENMDFTTEDAEPLRLYFGTEIKANLFKKERDVQYSYWSFSDERTSDYTVNWSGIPGTMVGGSYLTDDYLNANWDEEKSREAFYSDKAGTVTLSFNPTADNKYYRISKYSKVYDSDTLLSSVSSISDLESVYYLPNDYFTNSSGKAIGSVTAKAVNGNDVLKNSGPYIPEEDDRTQGEFYVYPGILISGVNNTEKQEDLTETNGLSQNTVSGSDITVIYGNNGKLLHPLSTDLDLLKTWIVNDGIGPNGDKRSATVGDTLTFTIKAVNRSKIPVKDVTITDRLKYDSWEYVDGSANLDGVYAQNNKTVTWSPLEFQAGEVKTFEFKVKVVSIFGGELDANSKTWWWNEASSNWGSSNPTQTPPAIATLNLEKRQALKGTYPTSSPIVAKRGDTLTYELKIQAENTEARGIVVKDTLEEGLSYVEDSTNYKDFFSKEGQNLTWNVGDLPAGSFITITYDVIVDQDKEFYTNKFTGQASNQENPSPFESNETVVNLTAPWGLIVGKVQTAQNGTSITEVDEQVEFEYTINLKDGLSPASGTYGYLLGNLNGNSIPDDPEENTELIEFTPDEKGDYSFVLKGGEYAYFYLLPKGLTYRVEESLEYGSGYEIIPNGRISEGTITDNVQEVIYQNIKKTPQGLTPEISAKKYVDMADGTFFNYPLKDNEFSFTVTPTNASATGNPVKSAYTVKNKADGTIPVFDGKVFTMPGIYTYTLKEVKGSNKTIIYSEDIYTIDVGVFEKYENGIYTGILGYEVTVAKDGKNKSSIDITNLYQPTPADIQIGGTKTLLEADGSPAEDHSDFEFEIEPGEFTPDNNAYLERGETFNTDILAYAKANSDGGIIEKITFTWDKAPVGKVLKDVSYRQDESVVMWNEGSEIIVSSQDPEKTIYCIDGYRMFKGLGSNGTSIVGNNSIGDNLKEIEFSNFDTSFCTDMTYMFYSCGQLTSLNLSDWNTQNVRNISCMFLSSQQLMSLDISGWDTGNVTDMASMFRYCSQLTGIGDLSGWNTSNVTNMSTIFSNCSQLKSLDLSGWNTEKVTDMSNMFYTCGQLTDIGDLSGWNTSKVTSMTQMFYECKQLTSIGNLSGWNTEKVTDMSSMFRSCSQLTSVGDLSGWDTSKVRSMYYMFEKCSQLTSLNLSGWNTQNVTDMNSMFRYCSQLTSLDLSDWNTQNVTNMSEMFYTCSQLTSVGDLSGWNTEKVKDMDSMFYSCSRLESLDLSDWNTRNVTRMYTMFSGCSQLTSVGDLSGWNTEKIPSMKSMFFGCSQLISVGDLADWNTSNVTTMSQMFDSCSQLMDVGDLSGWNTEKVTNMSNMFSSCSQLTSLDLSGWNTAKVTSMDNMFQNCSSLTCLDLSGWDTQNVSSVYRIFYSCKQLETIYASDWTSNSKVNGAVEAFATCTKLFSKYGNKGIDGNLCKPSPNGYFTDPSESPNYGKTNNTGNAEIIKNAVLVETESLEEPEIFGPSVEHLSAPLPLEDEIGNSPIIEPKIEEVSLHPYIQMLASNGEAEWPENLPQYSRETLSQKDGVFNFGEASFSTAGTYTYYVSEKQDTKDGVLFDTSRYKIVIVTVPNAETGKVTAVAHYYDVTDSEEEPLAEVDSLRFENKMYAPITAQITGTKTLLGKDITDGAYSFEISAGEGTPEELLPLETTVSVGSDGIIEFPEVIYTRPGDYSYLVREINTGDRRTEYDPTVYTVTVHVTANDITQELEASVTTDPDGGIQFRNTYFDGDPNLNIEKLESLDGEYWTDHLTASPEDIITYSLRVWNNGQAVAKNVEVMDNIPDGMIFVEADGDYTLDDSTLTWNLGTLLPNEERTLTFKAQLPETENGTVFTNTGYVRSENIGNPDEPDEWTPSNEVDVTVVGEAEIAVNKFQGKDTMDPSTVSMIVYGGDTVTYYLDVLSIGASTAKNVVVSDSVPEGLTLVDGSISDNGLSTDNRNITWNLGNMPKGSKKTLSFKVTVPDVAEATTWKNTALYRYSNPPEDSGTEPDTDIQTNEVTINEIPDGSDPEDLKELEIRKYQSLDEDIFTENLLKADMDDERITYKLIVENTGSLDIPDLRVEDEIPEGLTLIEESISENGYLMEDGKTIHWDLGFIGVGQTRTVTFSCTIPDGAGNYINAGTGIFSKEDPNTPEVIVPSNNVEVEKKDRAGYKPSISKEVASGSGNTGRNTTFNFTISDLSPEENIIFRGDNTVSLKGSGTVEFPKILFTEEGTYTFLIKEEAEQISNWIYDGTVYKYTVYVEDDGTGLKVKDVRKEIQN